MKEYYKQLSDWIKKFESYTSKAKWDVNAWRIGHGSDTITFPDGSYRKVVQGDVTTREMAHNDLQRRLTKEFEPRVIKKIGAEYWKKLPANTRIALVSVGYNYGNITKPEIVTAARTGDVNKIGKAIFDSTINDNKGSIYYKGLRTRRKMEWDLAIKPNEIDAELLNPSTGQINTNNLFFFGIIVAGVIYFMYQKNA